MHDDDNHDSNDHVHGFEDDDVSLIHNIGDPSGTHQFLVFFCQAGSSWDTSRWICNSLLTHPEVPYGGSGTPQNAINEANWAISRPGGSSLVDPGGSRLDLGGIHPGGCVTAF